MKIPTKVILSATCTKNVKTQFHLKKKRNQRDRIIMRYLKFWIISNLFSLKFERKLQILCLQKIISKYDIECGNMIWAGLFNQVGELVPTIIDLVPSH
jgi:hypothetical protein